MRDDQGRLPIHFAANSGKKEMVKWLIAQGVDIHAVDYLKMNLLHSVAFSQKEESTELYEMAQYLIQEGVDSTLIERGLGMTPFHTAMICHNFRVAQLLLEHGTPLEVQDSNGLSPLHSAVHSDHIGIVKKLVELGADIHAKDKNQATPLHSALRLRHVDIAKFLIE